MQCGYCISGILISAAALLQRNPDPSEAEVRAALDRNLCRCGAHNRIVRAVLRAAKEGGSGMSTGPGLGYHIVDTGGAALPGSLQTNRRLSQWLRFRPDGIVEVFSGKVEIGQGILTAVAQIVADELDVDLARIRMVPASTAISPNEGVTSGSLSIEHSGSALRYACAEARAIYPRCGGPAPRRGGAKPGGAGRHHRRPRQPAHQLLGAGRARACSSATPRPGSRPSRPRRARAGGHRRGAPRHPRQGVRPPALHPRPGAARPAARARAAAAVAGARRSRRSTRPRRKAMPGVVAVVRDGSFVGVVAETEEAAVAALERLARGATWQAGEPLPDEADLRAWIKSQPVETTPINAREAAAAGPQGRARCGATIRAPSSRTPRWRPRAPSRSGRTAACTSGRTARASTTCAPTWRWCSRLPPEKIVVEHVEGAGCYGQNGADDVALEAALLARAARAGPCSLQWSREDELAWAPFGAAQAVDLEADLDDKGEIVGWRHDVWSNGHVSRPGRGKTPTLLAAWQLAKPFPRVVAVNPPLAGGGGAERNATPLYDFPAWRITNHRLLTMPIRTSSLRTLGAFANVFAIESFMDELAAERGEDPLAFRLRHLKDPRARAVLEAAAKRAGWSQLDEARGRRPRHRLRALQGRRRLLRGGRRGRGRRRHPRAPAGDGGRRRRGRSTPTASPTRWRAAPSRPPAGC